MWKTIWIVSWVSWFILMILGFAEVVPFWFALIPGVGVVLSIAGMSDGDD